MQTITTRYFSPTNVRGSRYQAKASGGMSIMMHADPSLGNEENHVRAAQALIRKLGWFHEDARGDRYGQWFQGGTKDGYVYVCCVEYALVPSIGNAPEAK
jgi:hypothetical protein